MRCLRRLVHGWQVCGILQTVKKASKIPWSLESLANDSLENERRDLHARAHLLLSQISASPVSATAVVAARAQAVVVTLARKRLQWVSKCLRACESGLITAPMTITEDTAMTVHQAEIKAALDKAPCLNRVVRMPKQPCCNAREKLQRIRAPRRIEVYACPLLS